MLCFFLWSTDKQLNHMQTTGVKDQMTESVNMQQCGTIATTIDI